MHEYAIAQELVAQVERIAREHGAEAVTRVIVQVGRLRAVVPDILRWGFEVAAAHTLAEGAALVIEEIPIVIRCRTCDAESRLDDPVFICPRCGGFDVEPISGDELILKSLEIDGERNPSRSEYPAGQ